MKKIKLLFIIIFITLQGCKYTCPGYLDIDTKWIPYSKGKEFRYKSLNDSLVFLVNEYYKTPASSDRALAMDFECNETKSFYLASSINKFNIADTCFNGIINVIDFGESNRFKFNLYDKKGMGDSINVKYVEDTVLNNNQYKEVYIVSKDTNQTKGDISEIIKAANCGVVRFYNFKTKRTWDLVK